MQIQHFKDIFERSQILLPEQLADMEAIVQKRSDVI